MPPSNTKWVLDEGYYSIFNKWIHQLLKAVKGMKYILSGKQQSIAVSHTNTKTVCEYICNKAIKYFLTLAFSMHGQIAQAALAWTSGLGFFNNDHNKRTPSKRSIILSKESIRKKEVINYGVHNAKF